MSLKLSGLHFQYSYFLRKTEHANGTVTYWGMNEDILAIMAKNLNFTYYYTEPADQYWGAPDADGNWNGIIRELIDDVSRRSISVREKFGYSPFS